MLFDRITLDRSTFKVLASDTRVDILKRISERKQTLTDLSEELEMSPSTIKEHLDKLVDADLIMPLDRGTKWKYYVLTKRGKQILKPNQTQVFVLLSISIMLLFASTLSLIGAFSHLPALIADNRLCRTIGINNIELNNKPWTADRQILPNVPVSPHTQRQWIVPSITKHNAKTVVSLL